MWNSIFRLPNLSKTVSVKVHPEEIAAIVFDSQIGGVAVIDENNEPVAQFNSWLVTSVCRNHTFIRNT